MQDEKRTIREAWSLWLAIGPLSEPRSHTRTRTPCGTGLEHKVGDSTNKRGYPDGYRRLEAGAARWSRVGELGCGCTCVRDCAGGGALRNNARRGVLARRCEERVEVANELDRRVVRCHSRVCLETAGVGGEHSTVPHDVLGQVHVGFLGNAIDAHVVAPRVSRSVLGLVVYVGPCSLEIGVLYVRD